MICSWTSLPSVSAKPQQKWHGLSRPPLPIAFDETVPEHSILTHILDAPKSWPSERQYLALWLLPVAFAQIVPMPLQMSHDHGSLSQYITFGHRVEHSTSIFHARTLGMHVNDAVITYIDTILHDLNINMPAPFQYSHMHWALDHISELVMNHTAFLHLLRKLLCPLRLASPHRTCKPCIPWQNIQTLHCTSCYSSHLCFPTMGVCFDHQAKVSPSSSYAWNIGYYLALAYKQRIQINPFRYTFLSPRKLTRLTAIMFLTFSDLWSPPLWRIWK